MQFYSSNVSSADRNDPSSYKDILEDIYDYGLYIDFPVILEGFGHDTEISFSHRWSDTTGALSNSNSENKGIVAIAGIDILASSYFPHRTSASYVNGKVIFKNLKIKNTKIMVFENISSTYDLAANSDSFLEFNNVYFESDLYNINDEDFYFYTRLSSSYYHNPIKASNCIFKKVLFRFEDGSPTTLGATNHKTLSKFIFLSNKIIESSALIRFNGSVTGIPLDNFESRENIFDSLSGIYLWGGLKVKYDSLGTNNNFTVVHSQEDTVLIESEKTGAGVSVVCPSGANILLHTEGVNGDIKFVSDDGGIYIDCQNSTDGSFELESTQTLFSSSANTDIASSSSLVLRSTNSHAKLKSQTDYAGVYGSTYSEIGVGDNSATPTNIVRVTGNNCNITNSGELNIYSDVKFRKIL